MRDTALPEPRLARRAFLIVAALAGLLWQSYAVIRAWRDAQPLATLLTDLGVEIPFITRLFFASYRFWAVLPLLTGVVVAAVWCQKPRHPVLQVAAAGGAILVAAALQAWLHQALAQPLAGSFVQVK